MLAGFEMQSKPFFFYREPEKTKSDIQNLSEKSREHSHVFATLLKMF